MGENAAIRRYQEIKHVFFFLSQKTGNKCSHINIFTQHNYFFNSFSSKGFAVVEGFGFLFTNTFKGFQITLTCPQKKQTNNNDKPKINTAWSKSVRANKVYWFSNKVCIHMRNCWGKYNNCVMLYVFPVLFLKPVSIVLSVTSCIALCLFVPGVLKILPFNVF